LDCIRGLWRAVLMSRKWTATAWANARA
jgi:hypothetical protein